MLVFFKYLKPYFCFLWIFSFLLEFVQLKTCQRRLHLRYASIITTYLSNEFLLIYTHQKLIHMFHPFFYVNYFFNKHDNFAFTLVMFLFFKIMIKNETALQAMASSNAFFTCSHYLLRGILVFPPLPVNRFPINLTPDNMYLIIYQ